jgi:HPt (histidine-containing phosphotransfer) domain-containing protein
VAHAWTSTAEAPVTGIPDSTRDALDGLRALGGDGLVRQMVSIFIDHSAGRIDALRSALDAGDLPGVAGAAHTLKGSSRQLGLSAMADACLALEQACKGGDASTAQTLAAAVHESYTAAAALLREATA